MVEAHECSVDDCRGKVSGRGWCAKHYWRFRTYGDLDHVREPPTLEERFWANVDTTGSCWIWTAARDRDGYGVIGSNRKQIRAHRLSYELHNGSIPEDMVVMHSCDRPPCVNPEHLSLGTHAENGADSARKARRPRGSSNPQAKLTEEDVGHIRTAYVLGNITHKQLADIYGVSPALISVILARKAWKHI